MALACLMYSNWVAPHGVLGERIEVETFIATQLEHTTPASVKKLPSSAPRMTATQSLGWSCVASAQGGIPRRARQQGQFKTGIGV